MAQGKAIVKAVLSGDTLVLMGGSTSGPPPELTLTLSSLQAPRLARSSEQSNEPYAWASREYLRQLTIGKPVEFKVEYRVQSINRDFGSVWLNGENLCVKVAKAGWARVKTLEQSRDGSCQDLNEMLQVEQEAIQEKRGIHGNEAHTANQCVKWSGFKAEELVGSLKGSKVPAVIEAVRDGASMRAILKESMFIINFNLAGVQCPRVNPPKVTTDGTAATMPTGPAPFSKEAKHFTEVRVLHRDIQLLLEGVDSYGNIFGTIIHPAGNISVELLKNGFGKMSDWSAAFLEPSTRATMRNAEREAKLKKLRVWHEYVPTVIQGGNALTGKIIEVVSGDTLVALIPGKGEKRISLSSIRAPRMGNARKGEQDAPWAIESKDCLRNKAIGKTASINIEYEREPAANAVGIAAQKRVFASVIVKGSKNQQTNLAETLVAEGLAEVVKHRQDDDRSSHYDDLLVAESKSQAEKRGMHSNKDPGSRRCTDLSVDSNKAKQYLPFLKRDKTLKCVVEFVYTGGRVKLFVPKENCLFNFSLAGVKCPNPERRGGNSVTEADPFGEEAKTFTREHLMQRNVEVEIEDMDKAGTAFGILFLSGGKRENYACELLKEGLATIDDYSIGRTRGSAQLQATANAAMVTKKNLWSTVKQEIATDAKAPTSDDVIPVALCEIVTGGHFFVHKTATGSFESVEDKMKAFTAKNGTQGAPFEVKRGGLCAALFQNIWCRAKVESTNVNNTSKVRVRFVDYGNLDVVPVSALRPLDPTLTQIPAQAVECSLAFLKVPVPGEDFGQEAGIALNDLAWGRPLKAKVHGKDDIGRLNVSLYDKSDVSIGAELVRAGLARINRKARVLAHQKEIYDDLLKNQEIAKKGRFNLWQYGDIESDDEM